MSVISDHEAIRAVFARYCFCIDGKLGDQLTQLFTSDCVWDGGAFGRHEGHAGLRNLVQSAPPPGTLQHHTTNSLIEVDGDTARARSYIFVLNTGGETPALFVAGCYDDELVKRDGTWLIRSRAVAPNAAALHERHPF